MYKLKMVSSDEEIVSFEQERIKAFGSTQKVETVKSCPFGNAIKSGDMLAFNCVEEDTIVGGMLLGVEDSSLSLLRLYTKREYRGKGVGKFMLDYLEKHQEFFEDYFGEDIHGIIVEPKNTSVDYFFDKGYDYSGYQMYKSY